MKIGVGGHLVLGPFTERATRLIVVRRQYLHELDSAKSFIKKTDTTPIVAHAGRILAKLTE